jgi:hypothetical protein
VYKSQHSAEVGTFFEFALPEFSDFNAPFGAELTLSEALILIYLPYLNLVQPLNFFGAISPCNRITFDDLIDYVPFRKEKPLDPLAAPACCGFVDIGGAGSRGILS